MSPNSLAVRHLLLQLGRLNRTIRQAAEHQARIAGNIKRPDLTQMCVTDDQVSMLLREIDAFSQGGKGEEYAGHFAMTETEIATNDELRSLAEEIGVGLPLDVLAASLELSVFEMQAILICAAVEVDRAYERVFAYILDDLNRRYPCVELICLLTSSQPADRLHRHVNVGPMSRLVRCRILETFGEHTTGLRTQLRLGPGLLEFLLGASVWTENLWRDPNDIELQESMAVFTGNQGKEISKLGRAVADGYVNVAGIWSGVEGVADDVSAAIALESGLRLRRVDRSSLTNDATTCREMIQTHLHIASVEGAILQFSTDFLSDSGLRSVAPVITECFSRCEVPILLTGQNPWRPTRLLSTRLYAEIELSEPSANDRQKRWSTANPELDPHEILRVSNRYRISGPEIDAAAQLAQTNMYLGTNGSVPDTRDTLDYACSTVAAKVRGRFANFVRTKRGPDDLVLPAELHRQIMEVARFTRLLPKINGEWGFEHLSNGGKGIKCLFTGDPGTGKTISAEVIANLLNVPLMTVSISDILSKWVGETEQHLTEVFREAASNYAVLFLDEADSLAARRGEIRAGVDRYSNMEVSHLLQLLDNHDGLVVMATNLKDNLDPAFARRFHVVMHFPRPNASQRRRLWKLAFPDDAPIASNGEVQMMAALDMTGAGIMGAARTAALLAADENADTIEMNHVVRGVERQFKREARILNKTELGSYARYATEAP
jgi:hypothetical protein